MDIDSKLDEDAKALRTKLSHLAWFHGNISRNLAETRLSKFKQDGMYLIRQSLLCPTEFVLSLAHSDKYYHYMIENISNDNFFKMPKGDNHAGLDILVNYHKGAEHGLPSRLIIPCPGGYLPPPCSITAGYTNILHSAIKKGDKNMVRAIINSTKCPDLHWKDAYTGMTALHLTCLQGEDEIASMLLFSGSCKVDVLDKDGYTPLQRACQSNHSKLVKLLLVQGKANPQKAHRDTLNVALHEAALAGHLAVVKALLSCHVPAWPRNGKQQTPHELAVKHSHYGVAKLLDAYKPPPPKTKKEYWFHGKIDRETATAILTDTGIQCGYFLVRMSSDGNYALSMYCQNKVHHFKVNSFNEQAFYLTVGPLIHSIELFVEHYSRYKDGLPHLLTHAVDKDGIVRSMEDGAIIEKMPVDSDIIENLPPRVKQENRKEFLEIKLEDLSLGAELGQGEYGSVLRGKWKVKSASGNVEWKPVAVKTLNEDKVSNSTEQFLSEAKVMLHFDHPYIVKLIGVCHGPPLMLIQELVPNGSLLEFLLDYPERINLCSDICRWAIQVAHGMHYLESKKFVHRDLAARNILLYNKSVAKVGDFGLSRAVGEQDYYRATVGGRWPVKWYAPECMYYGTFSHQSDVWSYGITLWEMYSLGEQPYPDKNGAEVVEMIEQGYRLPCPDKCPDDVYAMMFRCWQYEPTDRPTFKALYKFFCAKNPYINVKQS